MKELDFIMKVMCDTDDEDLFDEGNKLLEKHGWTIDKVTLEKKIIGPTYFINQTVYSYVWIHDDNTTEMRATSKCCPECGSEISFFVKVNRETEEVCPICDKEFRVAAYKEVIYL